MPASSGPFRGLDSALTRQAFLRRSFAGAVGASSLAALLSACGSGTDGLTTTALKPPHTPTGTLSVAMPGQPSTVDPTLAASAADVLVTLAVFDNLIGWNDSFTALEGRLIRAWQTPDAREWTLTLRDGVRFHDGAAFDAEAVKLSLEYAMRPTSLYGYLLGAPLEIKAADARTVVIRYKQPFPDLARNMTFLAAVSPKQLSTGTKQDSRALLRHPIGTGPFRFVSQAGDRVVVEANADYFGDGPYLARLDMRVVSEPAAQVSALQAGDVEFVYALPALQAKALAHGPTTKITDTRTWTTNVMDIAVDRPPFDDLKVRQALAYAIDRQAIIDAVLRGEAILNNSVMPPSTYGYKDPSTKYSFDPDRARSLLNQAAGGSKVAARMVAYAGDLASGQEIGQAIASQLNDVGFDMEFRMVDTGIGVKDLGAPNRKNQIHILNNGWVNGGPFHIAGGYITSQTRYNGKDLASLVEKMNTTPDGPERIKAIGDAQDVLARQLPQFPLWTIKRQDGLASDVQGYVPPVDGLVTLNDAYHGAAAAG